MKKSLLLALVISAGAFYSQTSLYHQFPASAATWNINYTLVMGMCPPALATITDNYSIIIPGDTTINSTTYHKLFIPYVQHSPASCPVSETAGYKGGIREDVVAKKVYIIPPSGPSEQLLYDFSMQVGDTLKGYLANGWPTLHKVTGIDSVQVGASYRKRWTLNPVSSSFPPNNFRIIEGVGSDYGLLKVLPGGIVDYPAISITCFKHNGLPLYPSTVTSCNLITSLNSYSYDTDQIKISPNPVNNQFSIAMSTNEAMAVTIYDINGKKVLSPILNKGQQEINVSALSEGVYTIAIEIGTQVINKKIAIVH